MGLAVKILILKGKQRYKELGNYTCYSQSKIQTLKNN